MADSIFRIKRRLAGGSSSAPLPTQLANAELAFNDVTQILYYGMGIPSGDVTKSVSVVPIGGQGLFDQYFKLSANNTVTGNTTFSGSTDVLTVAGADNSTKAASTAWVRGYSQPLVAILTALAALGSNGIVVRTAAGTVAARAVATANSARLTVANGDAVAGNPTLDLATTGVSAGTFQSVTVDTYGRVTVGAALSNGLVVTALGFTPENVANKNAANGYAGVGADGYIPTTILPPSILGGMNYIGPWNPNTNTPALVSGVGTKGYLYKISADSNGVTTLNGNSFWKTGDSVVFNGTTWDRFEGGATEVASVAGRVGDIVLVAADVTDLGTMATQNANAVNITGGAISGIIFDGGTF